MGIEFKVGQLFIDGEISHEKWPNGGSGVYEVIAVSSDGKRVTFEERTGDNPKPYVIDHSVLCLEIWVKGGIMVDSGKMILS